MAPLASMQHAHLTAARSPARAVPTAAATGGQAASSPAPTRPPQPALPTLYDVPVSNYCARVRHVLYSKGLVESGTVALVSPASLGGLQSDAYKSLNPHAKMPVFHLPAGTRLPTGAGGGGTGDALYEADAIVRYCLAKWKGVGPSFEAPSPEVSEKRRGGDGGACSLSIPSRPHPDTPPSALHSSQNT